jgi:hypothetical protein
MPSFDDTNPGDSLVTASLWAVGLLVMMNALSEGDYEKVVVEYINELVFNL